MIRIGIAAGLLVLAWLPAQAAEHDVTVRDNSFDPAQLTIEAGDTVTWTNQGSLPHNVNADDNSFRCAQGCDGDGGNGTPSSANWSVTLTFDDPGEIPYHCDQHGDTGGIGMAGVITVEQKDDPPPEAMDLNFGHTGSWFKPEQSGQGFSVEIVPATQEGEPDQLVAYWFTYARGSAGGVNKQRWFVGQGPIDGPDAELSVVQVTGGIFDDPKDVTSIEIGSATFHATSCTEATLTYSLDLNGDGVEETTGEIALTRLTPDVVCEEMISESN